MAGGEPHRRARDAARDHVPPGRDPQGAADRRHRHAASPRARCSATTCRTMLEASVPGLADASGPRALPPRDAVAARGLDHRRHRPRVGDADRVRSRARRRPARSTTTLLARDRGRGGARRPRAGHVHVGIERRPEGRRAHARHRRARHLLVRCRAAGRRRPTTPRSSASSRSSGSAARSSSAPRSRRAPPCCASSASSPAPRSTSSRREQATHGDRLADAACRRCATTRRSPTASCRRSPASPSGRPTSRSSSRPVPGHPRAPRDERDRRQLRGGRVPRRRSRHRART